MDVGIYAYLKHCVNMINCKCDEVKIISRVRTRKTSAKLFR